MLEQSDAVQHAALCYGERIMTEQFLHHVADVSGNLQIVLRDLFRLHALTCIERDLPWFVAEELLTAADCKAVRW